MKICSKCGLQYPKSEFNRCKDTKDGLQRWCRTCQRESKKTWDKKNVQHRADYKAKYNTEHKNEVLAYSQNYRTEHLEECRKYDRDRYQTIKDAKKIYNQRYHKAHYQVHKQHITAQVKRYGLANPEKIRQYRKRNKHKRRSIALITINDFTNEQWLECKSYFNNECAYCGSKAKLEQDHLIPVTKHGGYTKSNIVPACRSCNGSKHNKDFEKWYPEQSFFSLERFEQIKAYTSKR